MVHSFPNFKRRSFSVAKQLDVCTGTRSTFFLAWWELDFSRQLRTTVKRFHNRFCKPLEMRWHKLPGIQNSGNCQNLETVYSFAGRKVQSGASSDECSSPPSLPEITTNDFKVETLGCQTNSRVCRSSTMTQVQRHRKLRLPTQKSLPLSLSLSHNAHPSLQQQNIPICCKSEPTHHQVHYNECESSGRKKLYPRFISDNIVKKLHIQQK